MRINFHDDQELLNLLLCSEEKAKFISKQFNWASLAKAHRQELGLEQQEYDRVLAAIEIGRRVVAARDSKKRDKIGSSADAVDYCRRHFATLIREATQEEFHVITLDTKNTVIDSHCVTVGTLDASLVHPREVFRVAIKDASASVILAHNHPSGDPTPSREDRQVTSRLTDSGELLGIDVLDHIVMGREGCVSIRELG